MATLIMKIYPNLAFNFRGKTLQIRKGIEVSYMNHKLGHDTNTLTPKII